MKENEVHENVLYKQKTILQKLTIGDFKFESVDSFTYLESVVSNENKTWTDIISKIIIASPAYKHTNSSD
jgi:hypothetical protein